MTVYLDLVILLNFIVDFLLLLGANRLCGHPLQPGRAAAAAALGSVYAGACLLPGFAFLGNWLWRCVSLCLIGVLAFGANMQAIRRGGVFVVLSFALGGMAVGMNENNPIGIIFGAVIVYVLCTFGLRSSVGRQTFSEVILRFHGKEKRLTALRDTGNTLKDPITGECVMVVGSDVAKSLLGLSEEDLLDPIATMEKQTIANLRLIPYRAVGQPNGMLLALRVDEVIVDKKRCGSVIAFAPQRLGGAQGYQALVGGAL